MWDHILGRRICVAKDDRTTIDVAGFSVAETIQREPAVKRFN